MYVFDLDFLGSKARIRTILCLLNKEGMSGAMYEAEIADVTQMSPTAVSNALERLIKEKIVISKKIAYMTFYYLDKKEFYKRIRFFKSDLAGTSHR